MAPASQKKGKKASAAAAKKESPAQKKQQQQEEEIVMKEVEQQKPEEPIAHQETSEVAASAATDEPPEGAVKEDETAIAADDTAVTQNDLAATADDDTVVEKDSKAGAEEEAAPEDMEGEDAGDVDEGENEENEEEEEEEEEEDVENPENANETTADEDVAMQNGDGGDDGNLEAEGSDGEGKTRASGVAKDTPDDNIGPSRGKIFIGGLSRETTTEVLTRHFEKYGKLTDSVIMKNRSTGQPRGFGFVTYDDPSIVDRVLQDTHVLDGRTVDAKRTVPRDKMSMPSKGPKTKKIFVGGLTSATTEDDLKTYFGKFGKISGCQIMQDHKIGKSRGFGFVTFESEQVVEEILAQGKMHEIDGKQVEIKKAEPKRAGDPPPVHEKSSYFSGGRRAGAGAYGPSAGMYGAYAADPAPMFGGAGGYYNRGGGRPGGLAYGETYGYGGGYGGPYGYGDFEEGYGGMSYNQPGYGSGAGYGYSYGGGGGYGSSSRGYGSGRYHPYSR